MPGLKRTSESMAQMNGIDRVEHIFVLMLENRSFDHLLGFSGLEGPDAETGRPTKIDGLDGTESNDFEGHTYRVSQGADNVMPVDPHHEFSDILHQLCGPTATYQPGGTYPPIDNSGFVASYADSGGSQEPGEVMKCFSPEQLPVLHALATEFAVCDNWHASMPGPTWPNRMFLHAGSSGGLDHSPSMMEMLGWEIGAAYSFLNGTIFDLLKRHGIAARIYGGDHFPMVAALKGIGLPDIREYENFDEDLRKDHFPYSYTFIEPSYDALRNYRDGTSQHPLSDIRRGEMLIKRTYEAIRESPLWESSLLIITWDENGGFYDHAGAPPAIAPGDSWEQSQYNRNHFTFKQYGPRVPAVVVSPLIPRGVIDHRLYDHTSVLATVEQRFRLEGLTNRDRTAKNLLTLLQNAEARSSPETLPGPNESDSPGTGSLETSGAATSDVEARAETVDSGNLPAIVYAAVQQHLRISPERREAILGQAKSIRTVGKAEDYLSEVAEKLNARKGDPGH